MNCTLRLRDDRADEAIALALNRRFASGRPSNRLHEAGVLLRAYDASPSLHPPDNPSWITNGPLDGVASASLVNSRMPYLFAGNAALLQAGELVNGQVGVVVSPSAAHASLACSYPGDAASIYVRCEASRRSDCITGCVGNRLLPGFCLGSSGERRRDFCRGVARGPTPTARQSWCGSGGDNGTTSVAAGIGGCDGSGCRHHLDYGGSKGGCAWRPAALAVAMELQENVTAGRLLGCPASGHPWCRCVAHRRTCCTYPACPLYNELILSAHELERFRPEPLEGSLEAVYFLERSASASDESFERAERAARQLHRALHGISPPCESTQSSAQNEAADHHPQQLTRRRRPNLLIVAPTSVSPILVAVDLSRDRPFRLVDGGASQPPHLPSAAPPPTVPKPSPTPDAVVHHQLSPASNRTVLLTYLAQVYPTSASWMTSSADAKRATEARLLDWFARHIQWLYREGDHGHGLAAIKLGLVTHRTHICRDCFFHTLRRLDSASRFAQLAPWCNGRTVQTRGEADCFRHVFDFALPAARSFTADDASSHVIEVTHLAFSSKGGPRRPTTWAEFLDSRESGSGFWFTHAPGSGIWYDAGRTLVASCKNTLLLSLLEEQAALRPHGGRTDIPTRCPRDPFAGGNATRVIEALRSTRERACPKWLGCMKPWYRWLDDAWDACCVELGRMLRYDTLFVTASPLDVEGHFISELVDLRQPRLNRTRASATKAEQGRWEPSHAAAWVIAYAAEGRLTLRDPLNPRDEQRVAACALPAVPTLRLACTNHISWLARDEPDCENWCVAAGNARR